VVARFAVAQPLNPAQRPVCHEIYSTRQYHNEHTIVNVDDCNRDKKKGIIDEEADSINAKASNKLKNSALS
jgi:hypothetical protein